MKPTANIWTESQQKKTGPDPGPGPGPDPDLDPGQTTANAQITMAIIFFDTEDFLLKFS